MTTAQKVIKYLAIAFALVLIINIISAILFGISGLASILGLKKSDNEENNLNEITSTMQIYDIKDLNIDIKASNLEIKKGESLKVESNNKNISCTKNGEKIIIKESGNKWFSSNKSSNLIIYIPDNIEFENVSISTGAGKIYIENLILKNLSFEIGAGKVQIENLVVLNEANIDGGTGKVDISSGEIHNLDLDMGVGEFNLTSKLVGNNDIDEGIGKLALNLIDGVENYKIKASKGIGSISINGKEVENEKVYGEGKSYIKIDGGIGAIVIE